MIPFVNIHTHRKPLSAREWQIRNAWLPERVNFPERPGYFASVGVHPWRAHLYTDAQIDERLTRHLTVEAVKAVGEIGLDRVNGPDFSLQKKVFERQWQIAEQYRKPLIIHCVKAYSDLLAYAKDFTVPFILHDYSGNAQTTEQLLRFTHIHFSFGRLLYRDLEKATDRLRQIPADRIFFETDTMPLPIESPYTMASRYLQTEPETWIRQVWENFVRITGQG